MTIKYAGLALAAGIVLTFISSILLPGVMVIDPVDQTDFQLAVTALGDAAALSQVMIFLAILGMLLQSFGLIGLYPLASRQEGLAGAILRFGIIISVIEWSVVVVSLGMRHFVVHLLQRGAATDSVEMQEFFQNNALIVYTDMAGVLLTFVALFPLASMMVGYGLVTRIHGMSVFKIAGYGLVLAGIAGLVNFIIVMLAPGDDPGSQLWANSIFLFLGGICLFVVGIGMFQAKDGLAESD